MIEVNVVVQPHKGALTWAVQVGEQKRAGVDVHTSQGAMELVCVVMALKLATGPCRVRVPAAALLLLENKKRPLPAERPLVVEVHRLAAGKAVSFHDGPADAGVAGLAAHQWRVHQETRHHLKMYTDGAVTKNHNGGWAFSVVGGSRGKGMERFTTSNRMELTAILQGLCSLPAGSQVTVHSDSQLAVGLLQMNWEPRVPPLVRLVEQIRRVIEQNQLGVLFVKVPAHKGIRENEWCDQAARSMSLSLEKRPVRLKKPEVLG